MTTCPHCDRTFNRQVYADTHVPVCLDGPMGETVRALVLQLSADGFAPSVDDYERSRTDGMPSYYMFRERYGSWNNYTDLLGLKPKPTRANKDNRTWERLVSIVDGMKAEHNRFMAQLAESQHGSYGQALHEWRERTYMKNGRERQERYTVLR